MIQLRESEACLDGCVRAAHGDSDALPDAQSELSEARDEIGTLQREAEQAAAKIAAQQETIEAQQAQIEAQRQEIDRLKEELREAEEQAAQQKAEFERQKADLERQKAELEAQAARQAGRSPLARWSPPGSGLPLPLPLHGSKINWGLVPCHRQSPPVPHNGFGRGQEKSSTPPCSGTRLGTSVCRLRHNQMEQGPTEPHAGCSTFLLSSSGRGGEYY